MSKQCDSIRTCEKSAADVTREHAPSRLNARRIDASSGRTREAGKTNADEPFVFEFARATYARIDEATRVRHSFIQKSERILFERTTSERPTTD